MTLEPTDAALAMAPVPGLTPHASQGSVVTPGSARAAIFIDEPSEPLKITAQPTSFSGRRGAE